MALGLPTKLKTQRSNFLKIQEHRIRLFKGPRGLWLFIRKRFRVRNKLEPVAHLSRSRALVIWGREGALLCHLL